MYSKFCLCIIAFSVALIFGETSIYYEPSKYSFQIKTNGLQDISSLIPGTMISLKKMTNSTDALRITAGISAGINTYIPNNSASESKSDSFSIGLYITKLKYAYRNKNLYLYYGYGPFGKYAYQFSGDSYEEMTTNSFSGGLNGCIGVEWFFSKQFSLFAEYSLNATANYSRVSNRLDGSNLVSNPTITKGFNLNPNSVLIGLSIYL
ncbi:MAG: outer membrane beta-barrel protein [Chitinivibrionales bacterium]